MKYLKRIAACFYSMECLSVTEIEYSPYSHLRIKKDCAVAHMRRTRLGMVCEFNVYNFYSVAAVKSSSVYGWFHENNTKAAKNIGKAIVDKFAADDLNEHLTSRQNKINQVKELYNEQH